MRTLIGTLFSVILCLTVTSAFGADIHWSNRLSGTSIASSDQYIIDGDYPDVLSSTFTDANQFGYVRLGIDEAIGLEFRGTRTVEVDLEITPYSDNNVAQTLITQTLTVEYSHDGVLGTTVDASDFRMPDVHKFQIVVTGFTIYDGVTVVSETIPDYIYLESGIVAERYYTMDLVTVPTLLTKMASYNSSGVPTALSTTTVDGSTDEIYVSWDYIDGAEYYDLEWTWVDNYSQTDLNSVTAATAIDLDENEFRHNSTRIRTSDQYYRIPHTFARGYIVFRVRGVGRWESALDRDLYGAWTTDGTALDKVSDWPDYLEVTAEHEAAKNWQYQATYAEEGKKKEVIQYFDGSLRSRQTVTRINSDDHSVVGETIYDNQGRGTIQILPVPQQNPAIKYYAGVNRNTATVPEPYSHLDFDWETSTSSTCDRGIPGGLDSNTGAAEYYSAASHSGDTDWQQYVPEANGFAFTQVEYTPDNTGRIRSQSGVGDEFTLGSGHETEYFYAQPSQEELNRLFGYKVGYMSRYKKNMVVDANGQVSISYMDAQGRVVATSLAGDNATSFEDLDSENNGVHESLTVDLLNKAAITEVDSEEDNNNLISTGTFGSLNDGLEYSTQVNVVSNSSAYEFDYSVETGYYEEFCDVVTGVKFPFVFDLELSLMDDCGNELFGTTYHKLIGDEELNSTVSEFLEVDTPELYKTLNQGTYTLTKRLTLNQAAFEAYLEEYLDPELNDCLLDESVFATTLSTDCSLTCDECVTELGTLSAFLQQAELDEGATLTVDQVNEYTSIYNQLKDDCLAPCELLTPCEAYHDMMVLDLTPNGQYASPDDTDPTSVLNSTNNVLTGHWQSSGLVYLDEFGNPATIEAYLEGSDYQLDDNGSAPQMVTPQELTLESFIAAFQPSWAEALLPYHPEYVYYQYAEEICTTDYAVPTSTGTMDLSSNEFDAILRDQISTYELAETGTNGNPYDIDFLQLTGDAIYDIDPYFNTTYGVHNGLTTLKEDAMSDVLDVYGVSPSLSLTQAAVKIAVYGNDPSTQTPTNATSWTAITNHSAYDTHRDEIWQQYKFLYLSAKDRLNQYFMDIYGIDNGIYNGCVGPDNFSYGVLPSFSDNSEYSDLVQEFIDVTFNTGVPTAGFYALCGSDYDNKEIRIIRTDGLYNPSLPSAAMAEEGQEMTDYAQWQETGLCPLTIDMERLLNELTTEGKLIQTNDMANINTMVPDLFEAVSGGTWGTSSELEMTGTIVGTTVELSLDNPTTSTNYCKVTIPQVGSLLWSNLQTSWKIFGVYNSFPTGTANDTKVIILAGADLESAEEYVVTYTTDCANLNDCQTKFSNNSQYDPNCTKEEDFENGIEAVLIELTEDGTYNNSSVSINSLTSFTNSVLPDYFDGTVTWDGTLGKFTFTSGSYNVGFTPTASTFLFNSYEIVEDTAYADFLTGSTSSPSVNEASGTFTYTSSANTLDFNCSCYDATSDESVSAVEASIGQMYLELFNYVLDNPSTTDATPVPSYIQGGAEGYDYDNPSFFDVSVGDNSLEFSIDEPNGTTCEFIVDLTWTGFEIDYFTNVTAAVDLPDVTLTIDLIDTSGDPHTLTLVQSDGDCSLVKWCDDCDVATVLEPISCTDEFTEYQNNMLTIFEDDYEDIDGTIDEDSVFLYEYVGSQQDFCDFSYAYISNAYAYYLSTLNITTVNDPLFLTIGQFGNTAIGYLDDELQDAVDDYDASSASNSASEDFLPWNVYIADVYLNSGVEIPCPPSLNAPFFPTSDQPFDCNQWINNVYTSNQQNQYDIYLEQTAEAFKEAYTTAALSTTVETFTKTYDDKEYHYTLYYYDRGGNLIQTVPPKGIDRLEVGETNTLTYEEIDAFRVSDPEDTMNVINNGTNDIKHAPEHSYNTVYRYNSLNQLVYQATPDGGESRFAYDALGRLVMSQNAKQEADDQYSYTVYDGLGRVIEVGEMDLAGFLISKKGKLVEDIAGYPLADVNHVNFPSNLSPTSREEVTRTIYDELVDDSQVPVKINVTDDFVLQTTTDVNASAQFEDYSDDNTRNRIVGVVYQELRDTDISTYESAIFYDYDVHGNVKELIQVYEHEQTKAWNQHVKHINYTYDLVSGNVNEVVYQRGQEDQFIHSYAYDSDNRITIAETSQDGVFFEKDAKYFYYDHGPLARTEIGEKKVQATDYAYTIQGWIKTVNGEEVDETLMMGHDGDLAELNENGGRDVFGYSLQYYENDYEAATDDMLLYSSDILSASQHGSSLYNGNIRAMYTAISDYDEDALATHQTKYGYDQLNRIKSMDGYDATIVSSNPNFASSGYSSEYSFDANGNLETLRRNAWNDSAGVSLVMDDFTYHYDESTTIGGANNNQLSWVEDDAASAGSSEFGHADIDYSMNSGNYDYDNIGQLVSDADEDIDAIEWKVTNKVEKITYGSGKTIEFDYDPMGNRIAKIVDDGTDIEATFYILDAQGNQMTTYTATYSSTEDATSIDLGERMIYGSSRVGVENIDESMSYVEIVSPTTPSVANYTAEQLIGDKRFELSNHLGNVLNVITDRKLSDDSNADDQIDFFTADVVSYSDYYPYGMVMPGKHGSAGDGYRYGFNGMEEDDEIKGNGNSYTTYFRQYDPRIARWFTPDPKQSSHPSESPYVAFHNNPIYYTDARGDDPPEKTLQAVAKEIVRNARFGTPKYFERNRKAEIQVGYSDDAEAFMFAYSGKVKPSKMLRSILEKVSNGDIELDCQFTTTLIYGATVLDMMGDDGFDELFVQTKEEKKQKGNKDKYQMILSPQGLSRGNTSVGLDSEGAVNFGTDEMEEGMEAANNAGIGSLVILNAINPDLVKNKDHLQEVMIKVGPDKYVAFDYTSGEDAQFFSLSEILEKVESAGSAFRVGAVQELNYEDD